MGTSLALSGYVELNYYLSLPENVALNDRSYVEIRNSVDGNSAKYLVKDCIYGVEDGMDIYKFSYRLNVKNIADKLELRVYTGDGTLQPLVNSYGYAISGNAFGYSVSDYINAVANSDTQSVDMTRLKSLCASLKTYGGFARVYFGYNASGLNPSVESISGYDKDTVGHEKVVTGTLPAGLEYMGSSLLLNSGTAIRHYFSVDTGHAISEYTFKIDGNVVANDAIKYKDTVYYIEIPGMSAQYLGYAHILDINNGAYTINYSALSYVYACLDKSTNVALVNTCKALYGYYLNAIAYFGDPGQGSYVNPSDESVNNRFDETNLIITNGNGVTLSGWNSASVDGKVYKYYSNPATKKVVTGFNYIDGNLYYFGQTAVDVGRMKTGFFEVADSSARKYGDDFIDNTPGASNRYFANASGVLHNGGWEKITAKETVAGNDTYLSEQVWSYYFAPNFPNASLRKADSFSSGTKTSQNFDISTKASEVTTGDVFIASNGDVVTLAGLNSNPAVISAGKVISQADISADDMSKYIGAAQAAGLSKNNYYRFNGKTGARDRAVMYFYGNYYGWGNGGSMWNGGDKMFSYIDDNQKNTIMSEAQWINSDTKKATMAEDFITVNGEEKRRGFCDLGNFPMASTRWVGDLEKDGTEASYYRFTNPYLFGLDDNYSIKQDYVSGCTYDSENHKFVFTEAIDGNVDVYDTIYYSFEQYKTYIEKYGHNNLVLMGASSGAGICVSIMMLANANGYDEPNKALLLSPWLDASMSVGNPTQNGNSNTDIPTLVSWGARYTRDSSINSAYAVQGAAGGPGVNYWMASPVNGCKTSADGVGNFAGIDNIYMYVGIDDPCKAACQVFYDNVKASSSSANINNWVYSGVNGCGHGFMFSSNVRTGDVLRDVAMRVMVE